MPDGADPLLAGPGRTPCKMQCRKVAAPLPAVFRKTVAPSSLRWDPYGHALLSISCNVTPQALAVRRPLGVVVTGDLVDHGSDNAHCRKEFNDWVGVYGLYGERDLPWPVYEGRKDGRSRRKGGRTEGRKAGRGEGGRKRSPPARSPPLRKRAKMWCVNVAFTRFSNRWRGGWAAGDDAHVLSVSESRLRRNCQQARSGFVGTDGRTATLGGCQKRTEVWLVPTPA
eukprot:354567-Chlamydomonas_euryale.AAC.1